METFEKLKSRLVGDGFHELLEPAQGFVCKPWVTRKSLSLGGALGDLVVLRSDISGEYRKFNPEKSVFADFLERARVPADQSELQWGVTVQFEERGSRQTARYTDSIGIQKRESGLFFSYGANGSQVLTDEAYRARFMKEVADSSGLPVEFTQGERGFSLRHAVEGRFLKEKSCTLGIGSPSGFEVQLELHERHVGDKLMQNFLSRFGSGKTFGARWYLLDGQINPDPTPSPVKGSAIGLARELELRAEKYEIHLAAEVTGLDAVEQIRSCFEVKDDSGRAMPKGIPRLRADRDGVVTIQFEPRGYELEVMKFG